ARCLWLLMRKVKAYEVVEGGSAGIPARMPRRSVGDAQWSLAGKAEPFRTVRRQSRDFNGKRLRTTYRLRQRLEVLRRDTRRESGEPRDSCGHHQPRWSKRGRKDDVDEFDGRLVTCHARKSQRDRPANGLGGELAA